MTTNGPLHPPAMKVHAHVKQTYRDRLVAALEAYDKGNNDALKDIIEGLYECRREWFIERMTNVELIEREAKLSKHLDEMKRNGYQELINDSWEPFLQAIKTELKNRGFD